MRKLAVTAASITLVLVITACSTENRPKQAEPVAKETQFTAHQISKSEEAVVLKQAREDLASIMSVRKNLAPLKHALSGRALRDFSAKVKSERSAGKITIRDYRKIKLKFHSYTKGIAGVSLDFLDMSYPADKANGKPLGPPNNTQQALVLALKKIEGQWKIIDLLSADATTTKKVR